MSMEENKLEKDFKETIRQINSKIVEAGGAIREAHRLAQTIGIDYLSNDNIDEYDLSDEDYDKIVQISTSPLESAMDTAGWRTSSWNC